MAGNLRLIAPEHRAMRLRAMFLQVDALNSSGEGAAAWALLEEIAQLPLDDLSHAQLALHRAWCMLPTGDPAAVARYMEEFVQHAEKDPTTICPQTADRIHCLCIGLPGIAASFERFFALSELVRGASSAPWHLAVLPVGAWSQLWRGRRVPVQQAIERGGALHKQFGSMVLVAQRMQQFRALYFAASGQHEAAEKEMQRQIDELQAPQAAAHRAFPHAHVLRRSTSVACLDASPAERSPRGLAGIHIANILDKLDCASRGQAADLYRRATEFAVRSSN